MTVSRRSFLTGLSVAGSAARGWAQDSPTFSVGVDVVSVLATVRDRDGRVVKDLTADDFLVTEEGSPRTIRYFSRETDLPLTIGLLVDTSRSQGGLLGAERSASQVFLRRVLRPDIDRAFVAQFDEQVRILQELTASRADLSGALQRLTIPGHFATLIYSAVRQCAEDVMKKQPGRKAFVLLTDGVAFKDSVSLGTAIEFAQRADTILFSIRFADTFHPARRIVAARLDAARKKGEAGLVRMAKETGGEAFEASGNQSIEDLYARIEESLRSQYSLGFSPEAKTKPGQYRKIQVTARDAKLVVTARTGYYSN